MSVNCEFWREGDKCEVKRYIGETGMTVLGDGCVYARIQDPDPTQCGLRLLGLGRGPKRNLHIPQTPTTGAGAIKGQWPGDETDAEISEALRGLS